MGLFNEHSSSISDGASSSAQGPPGPQGVGYKVDAQGNYEIQNKKLINVKPGDMDNDVMVKSQIEGYVGNKTQYLDGVLPAQVTNNKAVIYSPSGSIHTNDLYLKDKNGQEVHFYNEDQDLNQCRLYIPNLKNNDSYGGRLKSDIMVTSIDQTIEGKKVFHDIEVPTPTIDGHASNKAYVDNSNAANKIYVDSEISKIPTIDTTPYLKKDGSIPMTGNLQMNNNRIYKLPNPQLADEPATLGYVSQLNNNLFNSYLDLKGVRKMEGNLQMNGNHISGLTDLPNSDDQATNKQYVDDNIRKANIKPSHTPKNVFKYLMNDVNEWSSEYNIKVLSFSDLAESPHSWDKRVLNITPVKDGANYRFRLGLQMFPMKTNETYSLIVEVYNRDYKTWERQETYVNGTGLWVKSYNTAKLQYRYGSSGHLYYTKTLIKFKKTSSTAPIFVYFTVHFDDNGGDMNTYPKDFKNQVYILAYGIVGETDHVDSEVYDKHEAFEIDKTKMKMLVPLDMNGKQLININLNLKFGDIFKIIKCHTIYSNDRSFFVLARKDNNQVFSFSVGVYINSITFHNKHSFDKNALMRLNGIGLSADYEIKLSSLEVDTGFVRNLIPWFEFSRGLRNIRLTNLKNNIRFPFDVDVIVSYM